MKSIQYAITVLQCELDNCIKLNKDFRKSSRKKSSNNIGWISDKLAIWAEERKVRIKELRRAIRLLKKY